MGVVVERVSLVVFIEVESLVWELPKRVAIIVALTVVGYGLITPFVVAITVIELVAVIVVVKRVASVVVIKQLVAFVLP